MAAKPQQQPISVGQEKRPMPGYGIGLAPTDEESRFQTGRTLRLGAGGTLDGEDIRLRIHDRHKTDQNSHQKSPVPTVHVFNRFQDLGAWEGTYASPRSLQIEEILTFTPLSEIQTTFGFNADEIKEDMESKGHPVSTVEDAILDGLDLALPRGPERAKYRVAVASFVIPDTLGEIKDIHYTIYIAQNEIGLDSDASLPTIERNVADKGAKTIDVQVLEVTYSPLNNETAVVKGAKEPRTIRLQEQTMQNDVVVEDGFINLATAVAGMVSKGETVRIQSFDTAQGEVTIANGSESISRYDLPNLLSQAPRAARREQRMHIVGGADAMLRVHTHIADLPGPTPGETNQDFKTFFYKGKTYRVYYY